MAKLAELEPKIVESLDGMFVQVSSTLTQLLLQPLFKLLFVLECRTRGWLKPEVLTALSNDLRRCAQQQKQRLQLQESRDLAEDRLAKSLLEFPFSKSRTP